MSFIRERGNWVPIRRRKPVDVIIDPTKKQYVAYHLNQYTELFEDFQPEDEVDLYDMGISALVHLRYRDNGGPTNLPPNMYVTVTFEFEIALRELSSYSDQYIDLYNSRYSLISDVERFFNNRQDYLDLGIAHRRGSLLYGPPGNGKTRMAIEVARTIVEQEGIAILHTYHSTAELMRVGKALGGKPCVLIIEELTNQNEMPRLLSFLDGEESWDNVYVIATTNYPEELEANIVDRPGRFDLLLEFDNPDYDQRLAYFDHFMPVDIGVIKKTDGFSISYLKYVVSEHLINGRDIQAVIKEVESRRQVVKNKFKESKLGFGEM